MKRKTASIYIVLAAVLALASGCAPILDALGMRGSDGKDGADGVSLTWKGELPAPPASAQKNWAYYDSILKTARIYDGSAWLLLAADGANGQSGYRTAILILYQWAPSKPTLFPSGDSVYTWATGAFTDPASPNAWQRTSSTPAAGQTLWACQTVVSNQDTDATSVVAWNASSCYAVGSSGSDGSDAANGYRTAKLVMYRWDTVMPAVFPAGGSTFTWADGNFVAPATPNGWSLIPGPSVPGTTLWACQTVVSNQLTTPTDAVTWNATSCYAVGASGVDGANGTDGYRTAKLAMYQWAKTSPTVFPAGDSAYTWSTGAFTAPATPGNWTLVPGEPTPGQTLYRCEVTIANRNTGATDTVSWNATSCYPVGAAADIVYSGPVGSDVYLTGQVNNGGVVSIGTIPCLSSYTQTLTLTNQSAIKLNFVGTPTVKALGGRFGTTFDGLPEISATPITVQSVPNEVPASFDIVYTNISGRWGYSFRKRFRIGLQDDSGNLYSFEFEVSGNLTSGS